MDDPTRSMPWDSDAEKGVLSCFLHNPVELLADAKVHLPPPPVDFPTMGAFYHPANGLLYQVMLEMDQGGRPVEYIALTNYLGDRGLLDKIGGAGTLSELLNFVPTPAHYGYYKGILRDKMFLRVVMKTGERLYKLGLEFTENPQAAVHEAMASMLDLTAGGELAKKWVSAKEVMPQVCDDIMAAMRSKGRITRGLATGFTDLDRMLMGLKDEQFMVIGARPAMGKSAFMANVAENIAMANGHYHEFDQQPCPVGILTMEMAAREILQRMTLGRAGANLLRARDGFFSHREMENIKMEGFKLAESPMYFLDTGRCSIQELEGLVMRAKARFGLRILLVDYLQLMKSESKKAQGSRYIEVGEVAQGLKELAKNCKIPVIALAQLGRTAEERKGCVPQMADLRESGDIEQAADIIGLLYRAGYYAKKNEGKGQGERDKGKEKSPFDEDDDEVDGDPMEDKEAKLLIVKHRGGPTGEVIMNWEGSLTRFTSTHNKLNSNNEDEQQKH
jgi:replicative DNA helicase